eukprot:UN25435
MISYEGEIETRRSGRSTRKQVEGRSDSETRKKKKTKYRDSYETRGNLPYDGRENYSETNYPPPHPYGPNELNSFSGYDNVRPAPNRSEGYVAEIKAHEIRQPVAKTFATSNNKT